MECFSVSDSVAAMIGCDHVHRGLINEMITGMNRGSIVALFQWNLGSNVASQGYPSKISSLPMSVTRKRISL
jgi:hypothetical protein